MSTPAYATLGEGRTYTWEALGRRFGFQPGWLNRVGGMASLPRHGAVLVITHPGGGKSFDYDDYWDGDDLIYTGKGQDGPQTLTSENRYVADNSRTILVFEHDGPARLRFLGEATCTDVRPDLGPDGSGQQRRIYRFRLSFSQASALPTATVEEAELTEPASPQRRPRSFDPARTPAAPKSRRRQRRTPEETLALQEKATSEHHDLVATLHRVLEKAGWRDIQEIPAAVDLWATHPTSGTRVIFEAKTVSRRSEPARARAALAQLLEYRFHYGEPSDELCVVASHSVTDERVRFLRALGIDVVWPRGGQLRTSGDPINSGGRLATS